MNIIIGDPGTACPWCGKQFMYKKLITGEVQVICSYSECLIVPFGIFSTEEDARKAIRKRAFFVSKDIKKVPDSELKDLWDRYDGDNSPDGFEGEDIHLELNMRGLGDYCAV